MNTNEPTWLLYYKGTAIEMPYNNKSKLIALWESTIIKGIQCGVSIETQKKQIKPALDELERFINELCGGGEYDGEMLKLKMGEEKYRKFLMNWGLNIVCGLKLKVIVNDEMNGHLFIVSPEN